MPLAKIGKNGSFWIASSVIVTPGDNYSVDVINPINYYSLLDPSNAQIDTGTFWAFHGTDNHNNSPEQPMIAFALDAKIDDGKANSGAVRSGAIVYWNPTVNQASVLCSVGPIYTTTSGYSCTPFIRIGAQAGDPQ